ncbi:MAG: hypothetical protein ABEJ78_09220 [Haloferacaceae archaeon]
MAYRFVRATPKHDRMAELHERVERGDVERLDPFGRAMTRALKRARFDADAGEAVWVEEDYCSPPLAMEREAVLDDYFEDLTVVDADVDEADGWARIEGLPSLWDRVLSDA